MKKLFLVCIFLSGVVSPLTSQSKNAAIRTQDGEVQFSPGLRRAIAKVDSKLKLPIKTNMVGSGDFDGNGKEDIMVNFKTKAMAFHNEGSDEWTAHPVSGPLHQIKVAQKGKIIDHIMIPGERMPNDQCWWSFSEEFIRKRLPTLKLEKKTPCKHDPKLTQWTLRLERDAPVDPGEGASSTYFVWDGSAYIKVSEIGGI